MQTHPSSFLATQLYSPCQSYQQQIISWPAPVFISIDFLLDNKSLSRDSLQSRVTTDPESIIFKSFKKTSASQTSSLRNHYFDLTSYKILAKHWRWLTAQIESWLPGCNVVGLGGSSSSFALQQRRQRNKNDLLISKHSQSKHLLELCFSLVWNSAFKSAERAITRKADWNKKIQQHYLRKYGCPL